MNLQIPMNNQKSVISYKADRRSAVPVLLLACVGLLWVAFAPATYAQTLLSETTWGGSGSDVSEGVAVAPDGQSCVVGITERFTTDYLGDTSNRHFLDNHA